jgi:hypothetical protein
MRRMTAVGFVLLFLSLAASAQTATKGNISFGYSYVRGNLSSNRPLSPTISSSNLNGWFTSAEYKPIPWLGGVLDFGGNYGTERVTPFCEVIIVCQGPLTANANVHTFLFGPRASVSLGKVTPFAQALFGGAHTSASGTGFPMRIPPLPRRWAAGWIFASLKQLPGACRVITFRPIFSAVRRINFVFPRDLWSGFEAPELQRMD